MITNKFKIRYNNPVKKGKLYGEGEVYDISLNNIMFLYHYTAAENIRKIITEDGIKLRFTELNSFEDKMEGKHHKSGYEEAIQHSRDKGEISEEQYQVVKSAKESEKVLFLSKDKESGIVYMKSCGSTRYVFCLSLNGDNQKMWDEYIKNENKLGYSLAFSTSLLEKLFSVGQTGVRCELKRVIYDSKAFFEQKIDELHDCNFSQEVFNKSLNPYARIMLDEAKNNTKAESYKEEAEVRIILQIPKNVEYDAPDDFEIEFIPDDPHHLYVKIRKDAGLFFLIPSPEQKKNQEELENMKSYLKENGYTTRILDPDEAHFTLNPQQD